MKSLSKRDQRIIDALEMLNNGASIGCIAAELKIPVNEAKHIVREVRNRKS